MGRAVRLPRRARDRIDVVDITKAEKISSRVVFPPWTRAELHIGLTSLESLVRHARPHALRDIPFSGYLSRQKKTNKT